MNYIILSILVLALSGIYQQLNRKNGIRVLLLIFICFLLCFFAGSRSSYNDTGAYKTGFINFNKPFNEIFSGEFSISNVYGFQIWQWFIKLFTDNYHFFFFFSSAIFVIPSVILIAKYSENFTLSMTIFLSCGGYLFSLAALKQIMATGIMLLAILIYLRSKDKGIKKYIIYYLFCFLALSFHSYAIIYLFIPLFGKKIFNNISVFFLVLMIALSVFSSVFNSLVLWICDLIGKDINEETLNSGNVNIFRALVFAVPLVWTVFGHRNIAMLDLNKQFIVKLSLFSSSFMIMALFGNPILFGRLPFYFVVATATILPTLINTHFAYKDQKIINLIAFTGYMGFVLYELYVAGAFSRDIFNMQLWWF